jgi:predicted O-methyltransferase YrrM
VSDITKALEIDGWMFEPELAWLADRAQEHQQIVEVGCMIGRSVRALADNTPGTVIAFDWFEGPPESTGKVVWTFEKPENQLASFAKNLREHIVSGKVVIVVGNHREAAKQREKFGAPDMVFIDGDHVYGAVASDILTWKDWLAPGGLLCGHDITIGDVKRAADELLPGYLVAERTTIWYWVKP